MVGCSKLWSIILARSSRLTFNVVGLVLDAMMVN
jgi:hypothetical protein